MNYPKVCVEAGALFVEFAQVEERSVGQPIRMIVDFGQDGEVLGIEIINLTLSAGENSLAAIEGSIPTEGKGLKYSYDDESDSFYLCLKTSRSSDQKAVQGSMFLDRNGSISALSAEWKSME